MVTEDEYLERIVAGIHAVTSADADVRWNEKLNGRQFDVVVRFTLGTLRYLVLVEVKNRKRKASASDVEAFVTKAHDQLASKAVFVTAAGFQKGAREVAARHGVELFIVSFDDNEIDLPAHAMWMALSTSDSGDPPTISIDDPKPVTCIAKLALTYTSGREFSVPSEQSQMIYYMLKTRVEGGTTLYDWMQSQSFGNIDIGHRRTESVKVRPPIKISPPDDYFYPSGAVSEIRCELEGVMSRKIHGNVLIEPTALRQRVVYTNALTGDSSQYRMDELPLGNTEIREGSFYFGLHPLRYYHCAKIESGMVTWDLIESFQSGQKQTATFTQRLQYASHYMPVTDRETIARLERRLCDYRSIQLGQALPPPRQEGDALHLGRRLMAWLLSFQH